MKKSLLINLLATHSPSGYEMASTEVFSTYLKGEGLDFEFRDEIGNCAYAVGKGNVPFMLSGHIDQVGLQVQHVDDKGFIHFITDGGVDPKTLPGAHVAILSKDCEVDGVIGKTPIHIEFRSDDKDKALKVKDLKIDIGATSKEEALSFIQIGNPIAIKHPIVFIGRNRLASGGIDDKIGVYITAEVMAKLMEDERNGSPLKCLRVYGVACTQEEVGGNGATIAAKRINPKYSIDYDVTFATDDDCVSPNEWGDIKLGKGGAIAHGVDSNKHLTKLFKDVCEENKISYQEFSVGSGGTDTVWIKQSSTDCETLLLSIPNRNMHTQVEVCDFRDLESLIEMTVAAIVKINNELT
jgi:endoglucanase